MGFQIPPILVAEGIPFLFKMSMVNLHTVAIRLFLQVGHYLNIYWRSTLAHYPKDRGVFCIILRNIGDYLAFLAFRSTTSWEINALEKNLRLLEPCFTSISTV